MPDTPRMLKFVDIRPQIKLLNEQESTNIYVINRTETRGDKGGYILTVTDEFGRDVAVSVPKTFIPVNIAEEISKECILKSTNFLNALRQGMLVVVSDQEAEVQLGKSDALYESRRIYMEKFGTDETITDAKVVSVGNSFAVEGQQTVNTMQPVEPGLPPLRNGVGVVSDEDVPSNVNPLIVEAMEHTKLTDDDRFHIVIQQGNLSDQDLSYIMTKSTDTRLREWASNKAFSSHRI